MAQAGKTPIITFHSPTPGNVPTTSNLAVGELSLNVPDKKLYFTDGSSIFNIATPIPYSHEYHINPVNGNDSNIGTYELPFLTIAHAQSVASSSPTLFVLHIGTYSENVTITNTNQDFVGTPTERSGNVNLTGTWTFNNATSLVRCSYLSFANTVTLSNAGSVYMSNCTTASGSSITQSGSGYFEASMSDLSGLSGISMSNGTSDYFNCKIANFSQSGGISAIRDNDAIKGITLSGGTTLLSNIVNYAGTIGGIGLTQTSTNVLVMQFCKFLDSAGSAAPISLSSSGFHSLSSVSTSSTTFSGTDLGTVSIFDAIQLLSPLAIASGGTNSTATPINGGVSYGTGTAYGFTAAGTSGQLLKSNGSAAPSWTSAGSGTVTSASVVSANGFAGTVATNTTTPAITLSTSITGVLKGNGTALSAATAGTDYVAPGGALGTPSSGTLTNCTFPTLNQNTSGNAATATTATNATNIAITDNTTTNSTVYPTWVTTTTGNLPQTTSSTKFSFVPSTGILTTTGHTLGATGLTFSDGSTQVSHAVPQVTTYGSGSGTYTVPTNAKYLTVRMIGGGGNGGSAVGATAGGGGGAGGYLEGIITSLSSTYSYAVGAAGGATTFGTSLFTANGGSTGISNSFAAVGGSGGTASGGYLNLTGGSGGYGWASSPYYSGGIGASTQFGGFAQNSGTNNGNGSSATSYGGGGSGAVGSGTSGSGMGGIIIVTAYF